MSLRAIIYNAMGDPLHSIETSDPAVIEANTPVGAEALVVGEAFLKEDMMASLSLPTRTEAIAAGREIGVQFKTLTETLNEEIP